MTSISRHAVPVSPWADACAACFGSLSWPAQRLRMRVFLPGLPRQRPDDRGTTSKWTCRRRGILLPLPGETETHPSFPLPDANANVRAVIQSSGIFRMSTSGCHSGYFLVSPDVRALGDLVAGPKAAKVVGCCLVIDHVDVSIYLLISRAYLTTSITIPSFQRP